MISRSASISACARCCRGCDWSASSCFGLRSKSAQPLLGSRVIRHAVTREKQFECSEFAPASAAPQLLLIKCGRPPRSAPPPFAAVALPPDRPAECAGGPTAVHRCASRSDCRARRISPSHSARQWTAAETTWKRAAVVQTRAKCGRSRSRCSHRCQSFRYRIRQPADVAASVPLHLSVLRKGCAAECATGEASGPQPRENGAVQSTHCGPWWRWTAAGRRTRARSDRLRTGSAVRMAVRPEWALSVIWRRAHGSLSSGAASGQTGRHADSRRTAIAVSARLVAVGCSCRQVSHNSGLSGPRVSRCAMSDWSTGAESNEFRHSAQPGTAGSEAVRQLAEQTRRLRLRLDLRRLVLVVTWRRAHEGDKEGNPTCVWLCVWERVSDLIGERRAGGVAALTCGRKGKSQRNGNKRTEKEKGKQRENLWPIHSPTTPATRRTSALHCTPPQQQPPWPHPPPRPPPPPRRPPTATRRAAPSASSRSPQRLAARRSAMTAVRACWAAAIPSADRVCTRTCREEDGERQRQLAVTAAVTVADGRRLAAGRGEAAD